MYIFMWYCRSKDLFFILVICLRFYELDIFSIKYLNVFEFWCLMDKLCKIECKDSDDYISGINEERYDYNLFL